MPITNASHWICTHSGRKFFPLEPKAEDVDLGDIVHSLSQQCRYTGHTSNFYSVAEHSVLVSKGVAALGGTLDEQKWGLLHDATEAYVSDISAPVKRHPSFAFYREVEAKIQAAVAEHFGLPMPEPEVVRLVDAQMIAFESVDKRIIANRHPDWPSYEQDPRLKPVMQFACLLPASASGAFMGRYRELFG